MTLLADYTAGTISVSANGTAVTGAGTAWQTAGFREGDWFIANGWVNVVAAVNSNTSLTLAQPWRGGALSGASYRLRYMSDGSRASAQARQLIDLLGGSGNLEALAGLVGEVGKVPVFTGAGTMDLVDLSKISSGREFLSADRTYYVRDDGDDGNDGLTDSAAGAFATIQRAIDEAASLDLGVYDCVISIGPGTWVGPFYLKSFVGAGRVILRGDTAMPSNVVIDNSTGAIGAITAIGVVGVYRIEGMRIVSSAGRGVQIEDMSVLECGEAVEFGVCSAEHIRSVTGSNFKPVAGGYSIVGGASRHIVAYQGGMVDIRHTGELAATINIAGTPNFSTAFVQAVAGIARVTANWVGSATGKRYDVSRNGTIISGGGANYLPGDVDGTESTGGVYD